MGIKVLSLFDGMSCGRIALERVGIEVENYFASEINKFAIQIAQKNFPNTLQLGDIQNIKGQDYKNIDLIIGGSPCQGFSRAGKGENFKHFGSKLFFEFVRILKETKPKYFLLENVKMKKDWQNIISEHLFGIEPIEINSSLVSAQNRKRLYWVGELQLDGSYKKVKIPQPKDRGIFLKDILEDEVEDKYYLSEKAKNGILKYRTNYKVVGKTPTLTCELAHGWGKNITPGIIKEIADVLYIKNATKKGYTEGTVGDGVDYSFPNSNSRRGRVKKGKTGTLSIIQTQGVITSNMNLRKLTPLECERLQTLPDKYTEGVSDTQRYIMIGNGWVIDVISHIFKHFTF